MEIGQERMEELAKLAVEWAGGEAVDHPVLGWMVLLPVNPETGIREYMDPFSTEILGPEGEDYGERRY